MLIKSGVYALIFSFPTYWGCVFLKRAVSLQLRKLDVEEVARRQRNLIILTSEVVIVIMFSFMHIAGCFMSHDTGSGGSFESEAGGESTGPIPSPPAHRYPSTHPLPCLLFQLPNDRTTQPPYHPTVYPPPPTQTAAAC